MKGEESERRLGSGRVEERTRENRTREDRTGELTVADDRERRGAQERK